MNIMGLEGDMRMTPDRMFFMNVHALTLTLHVRVHSCRCITVKCPYESVSQMQMTQIIKGRDFSFNFSFTIFFSMHEYTCTCTFPMFTTVIDSELLIIVNFTPKFTLLFLPIIVWKINNFLKFIYAWNESCPLKPCIKITPKHSTSYTICPKLINKAK